MDHQALCFLVLVSLICVCGKLVFELEGVDDIKTATDRVETRSTGPCSQDVSDKYANCIDRQLDDVPDYLMEDVRLLDLSRNNIRTLFNRSFHRYRSIEDLGLSRNDMRFVESAAFHPLTRLRRLVLNYNPNIHITSNGIFRTMQHIEELYLNDNGMDFIPEGLLKFLPRLKIIELSSNRLDRINITSCSNGTLEIMHFQTNRIQSLSPDTCNLACKTENLFLSFNPITKIDPNTIAGLPVQGMGFTPLDYFTAKIWSDLLNGVARSNTIEKLVFRSSDFSSVPADLFNPLKGKYLSTLDLAKNKYISLSNINFSNLNLLEYVILDMNYIPSIVPEFFDGMSGLRNLSVQYCGLETLNPNNSRWTLNNLVELDLGRNQLRKINSRAFLGLTSLKKLVIQMNAYLTSLEITSFSGLPNLEHLDVYDCRFLVFSVYAPLLKIFIYRISSFWDKAIIPGETFKYTGALEKISITVSINSRNLYDPMTKQFLFRGLENVTHLQLNNNNIDHLPSGVFSQLSLLRILNLGSCLISSIDSDVFEGLESLIYLNLVQNQLQRLPLITDLRNLQRLWVNLNVLSGLDEDTFKNNLQITYLDLRDNRFEVFNQSSFIQFDTASTMIDLTGNPIACNCRESWLVEWMNGPVQFRNKDQINCSEAEATLPGLRGKLISDFNPGELCGPNIALYTSIAVLAVAASAITVIAIHYRWLLRYKFYLLKLAILGYDELQDAREHGDFEYDINIMYADNDDAWVQHYLRPGLAERLPDYRRNVYGDGGLTPGMHYMEAVLHVVENSFKTVVVVSRDAILDNWFLMKFRIALDHVNDRRMDNMLVVFLDDVPDDELPFLVKLYLTDGRPFISWEERMIDHNDEQECFWDDLLKQITVNLLFNRLIPPE